MARLRMAWGDSYSPRHGEHDFELDGSTNFTKRLKQMLNKYIYFHTFHISMIFHDLGSADPFDKKQGTNVPVTWGEPTGSNKERVGAGRGDEHFTSK